MADDTAPERVYRHGKHAGDLADVHKHACLAWLMRQLTSSGAPVRVLDTHAGVHRCIGSLALTTYLKC